MKDYYYLLGLDRNLSETELLHKIEEELKKCDRKIKSSNVTNKNKWIKRKDLLNRFSSVLYNYETKENYDRALNKINSRKVKVNAKIMQKLEKYVIIGSLVAVMASGISANLVVTKIPVDKGETIEQVVDEAGLSNLGLGIRDYFDREKVYKDDGEVTVVHGKSKSEEAEEYASKKYAERVNRYQNQEENKTYSFNYIVQYGDTLSELGERFNATSFSGVEGTLLREGKTITVYTKDKELADSMNAFYAEQTNDNISQYYDYVIQAGDTIVSIAQENGVKVQDIIDANDQIEDTGSTLYAGDTIRIPVFEKAKSLG